MQLNRFMLIRPGDMVVVDFGTSTIRSRAMGRHPAFVVSVDNPRATGSHMMVIPAFHNASYDDRASDVLLKKNICSGLRHEMYVNASNLQRVDRNRIIRKIGHVNGGEVMKDVKKCIMRKVGETDEQKG